MCDFRPEALQCAPGNTANCLTSAQVETVRQIYTDYYGEDGSLIFPRMLFGSFPLTQLLSFPVKTTSVILKPEFHSHEKTTC